MIRKTEFRIEMFDRENRLWVVVARRGKFNDIMALLMKSTDSSVGGPDRMIPTDYRIIRSQEEDLFRMTVDCNDAGEIVRKIDGRPVD